jgi:hypothetical protein
MIYNKFDETYRFFPCTMHKVRFFKKFFLKTVLSMFQKWSRNRNRNLTKVRTGTGTVTCQKSGPEP